MTPRSVRYILYGAFYLLILALIFYGIYYFWFKPPATPVNEYSQLKPLITTAAVVLPATENKISLLAKITNPNPDFGAQSFSYRFNIFGPFNVLSKTISGQSFIYPGEEKYLIAANIEINPRDVSQAELVIDDSSINWQPQEKLVRPNLSSRSIKTEIKNQNIEVSGLVKNQTPLILNQVKIFALLYNNQNKILNASYTTINNIQGFQEQFFIIPFPKGIWSNDLNSNRTEIFLENEIF